MHIMTVRHLLIISVVGTMPLSPPIIYRVHSLPQVAMEVNQISYELCDALLASDHRPVSSVLRLNLYPSIKRRAKFNCQLSSSYPSHTTGHYRTARPVSSTRPDSSTHALHVHAAPSSPLVFHIRLSRLQFNLNFDAEDADAISHGSERDKPPPGPPRLFGLSRNSATYNSGSHDYTVGKVAVMFPLPSETQLDSKQVVKQLDCKPSPPSSYLGPRSPSSSNHDEFSTDESSLDIEFSAAVQFPSPEGTLHALIKLIDNSGGTVAQGVIAVPT